MAFGKFMLIPVEQAGRFQLASALAREGASAQLDAYNARINDILENKSLPVDVKAAQLGQARSQLENFKSAELNKPLKMPVAGDDDDGEIGSPAVPPGRKIIDEKGILRALPKSLRASARRLIQFVKHRDEISINKDGEISIDGARIRGSNFEDVVEDLMRNLKGGPVVGALELGRHLIKEGVPPSKIKNKHRREALEASEQEQFRTPASGRRSKKLGSAKRRLSYSPLYSA